MGAAELAVAIVAAAAGAGVTVLVRTGWLQSRTLEKCIGLSVVLHLVIAVVAAFVGGWSPASWGQRDEGRMTMLVVLADNQADDAVADAADAIGDPDDGPPDPPTASSEAATAEAPPLPSLATAESPPAPPDLVPLLDAPPEDSAATAPADEPALAETGPTADDATPVPDQQAAPGPRLPATYADRIGHRRAAAAAARGGSEETERAVRAALAWLARNQSSDGRWDAARHGAGRGRMGASQHAADVGARADHGVTGLALLAFLGAGNTHREGPHAATVARGLGYLVERQRADGSLAGEAAFFASLYCHGMATIAVAEAAAMSGDEALRPVLDRAVRYTLAMQHPITGGWRYAAGDRGDTSQLGWQVMALAAAKNAGLSGFESAEARAGSFLTGVSSGTAGGLVSYRPGERASLAMTAEALFCRLLMGMPADHPAAVEACGVLSQSLPSRDTYNIYTWYYGTLASFHAGGPQWDAWNRRLQTALLPLQHRSAGHLAGSWDPDGLWGRHGGRVYATALAALTLEVYYRYLPLHDHSARMAARP